MTLILGFVILVTKIHPGHSTLSGLGWHPVIFTVGLTHGY